MTNQASGDTVRAAERRLVAVLVVALIAAGAGFRVMGLSSVPGISGDEGWWGVQSVAWLSGRPYEAHTTSGNPTDLFFLIPVALANAVAAPSFAVLRAVPVLVNLLALPVGFWFVRRLYGVTTAWIYTVALAILPTAIAHSRICQDPSQSVFWTTLVIGLSLLGFKDSHRAWAYLGAALLVLPVALWTHPTNVFIVPFLALPVFAAIRRRLPASRRGRGMLFVATSILAALGLLGVYPALRYLAPSSEWLDEPWLSTASARMVDGAQWLEFAANNVRLFNGVTIYHYFSGARPVTLPYDLGFMVVMAAVVLGFLLTPPNRRVSLDLGVILACAGTWVFFYALAGPQALRPHAERWGLCLIVPATLVVARGLSLCIEWRPTIRRVAIPAAALVATSVLASFYFNYFKEFATTGGRSHLTYITAPIEPKQQALEHIIGTNAGSSDRVTVVAQQWWIYWPIAYLATAHPRVSVTMGDGEGEPWFQESLRSNRLYFVEFTGTTELATTKDRIRDRGWLATPATIRDAGGRDHLEILQVGDAGASAHVAR